MKAEGKREMKTTELRFVAGRVRLALDHAKSCEIQLPMDGDDRVARGPGLVLIAESTIYLASNGKDTQPLDRRVVFAEGMDPDKWEDEFDLVRKKVELVGEEDRVAFLRASDIEVLLERARDWDVFRIRVVHDGRRMSKVLMLPVASREEVRNWEAA